MEGAVVLSLAVAGDRLEVDWRAQRSASGQCKADEA
jgi:hypothetical protein